VSDLAGGLGALASEAGLSAALQADLRALAGSMAPAGDASVDARAFLAALRTLDEVRRVAPGLGPRALELSGLAAASARACGARVLPDDLPPPAGAAPRELPAFGEPVGALVGVVRHGFVLGARTEPATVRVARGPAPPWVADVVAVRAALLRAALRSVGRVDGASALAAAVAAWLEALPGEDEERRVVTLRYAATAAFSLVEADEDGPALFARLARTLDARGQTLLALDPAGLADVRRYEVVPRAGTKAPRVVRPGFQGKDGVVVQRARIIVDPGRLHGA
jgi:hypothetical protein